MDGKQKLHEFFDFHHDQGSHHLTTTNKFQGSEKDQCTLILATFTLSRSWHYWSCIGDWMEYRKHWHVQEMSCNFSFQSGHFHFMNIALELSFFLEAIACIFTRFLSSIDPITFRYWRLFCLRPALSINFLLLLCNWKNLVFSKQSNNGEIQIIYCNNNCCEFTGTKLKESPHLNCCLFGIFLGNSVSFIRNYRIQFSNEYDCKWNVNLPELLAWTHRHNTSCRSPWLAKDLLSLPPSLFLFVYSGSFFSSIKRCLESCPPIASCSFSSIVLLQFPVFNF